MSEDLDYAEGLLKGLIDEELQLYHEAKGHGDHKNLRAHGGLLSILMASLVRVILAKHKIGALQINDRDLSTLLSEIEVEPIKQAKKALKRIIEEF